MPRQKIVPRGIRNNNPLNIRIGNVWLGETNVSTDPDFEQFVAMKYGLRAAFVILRRYIRRYGRNTVRSIMSAWAPSSENKTDAYIDYVASHLQIGPDEPIRYEDKETMTQLVYHMAMYENGQPVDLNCIKLSYDLA